MISSVTFETASLADAIKKADKVAPKKGAAFDKAAGIVLEFDPSSPLPLAIVKSTNLEISSMEWVTVAEWAGEAAQWRLPSFLLAMVVGTLPIGTGKTVTFESERTEHSFVVNMSSGRTKVKFHPIDVSYYPEWGAFSPDDMFPAKDLGGRIDQVEWAVSKSELRFSGVFLDGEYATATDGIRLARVPLQIPKLPHPIVVPGGILGSILRQTGDIQIGASENQLHIMPDEQTQIRSVLLDVKTPNLSKVTDKEYTNSLKIQRDQALEVIRRVDAFSVGDRVSAISVFIGMEEIAFYMKNPEMGQIGDVIEVPGYADHERFKVRFTTKNLIDALSKSPNNEVVISYNVAMTQGAIRFDGGSGYQAWVMSRTAVSGEE